MTVPVYRDKDGWPLDDDLYPEIAEVLDELEAYAATLDGTAKDVQRAWDARMEELWLDKIHSRTNLKRHMELRSLILQRSILPGIERELIKTLKRNVKIGAEPLEILDFLEDEIESFARRGVGWSRLLAFRQRVLSAVPPLMACARSAGTEKDLPHLMAYTDCPACFERIFARSRFCEHCGARARLPLRLS